MERLHCHLVVLILLAFFWARLEAQFNVDTEEPSVILSPARKSGTDREDEFGRAAVFHQIEEVVSGDNRQEVLRKTRLAFFCYDNKLLHIPKLWFRYKLTTGKVI